MTNARRFGLGAGLVALVVLIGGGLYIQRLRPQLDLGVGYGARVACSCRFVANRTLGDCKKDFVPGMELISLREDVARREVTAYVPLVAHRTVRFTEGLGCQPEAFRGTPYGVTHKGK